MYNNQNQNQMNQKFSTKWILIGVVSIIAIIVAIFINPFAWNDSSEGTVVQQSTGNQFVQYKSGVYYAGFFAKTTQWPNQISVSYQDTIPNMELNDGTIEIGKVIIRFGADATSASVSGIVQYILPSDETEMIAMHNAHKTPQSLVSKRLAPYTKECLQSSAQMMSSEMHYSGGRSTMSQDFGDQLRNGVFILKTTDRVVFDSLENEKKKVYVTEIITNKNGDFHVDCERGCIGQIAQPGVIWKHGENCTVIFEYCWLSELRFLELDLNFVFVADSGTCGGSSSGGGSGCGDSCGIICSVSHQSICSRC